MFMPTYNDLLKEFQNDYNRLTEEGFAQILTERSDLRLFFINEDECFTDGRNIIIDPAFLGLFSDISTLKKVEEFLNIGDEISSNPFITLKMCARSPNIHECLHIIYTDFPPRCVSDTRGTTNFRKKVLANISNIIEDAFIEAAGCSEFDNLVHFLLWFRLGIGFVSHRERNIILDDPLASYLDYMCGFLLYPFIKPDDPCREIADYVEKTKQLFTDGAVCGESDERYSYTQKIFDIIEPLVPKDETDTTALDKFMERSLVGSQTHSGENSSIASFTNKGKTAVVTRRLFTDKEGNPIEGANGKWIMDRDKIQEKFDLEIIRIINDENAEGNIIVMGGKTIFLPSIDYDCSNIHKDIKIKINNPKINLNLKKAYQNIVTKHRLTINSFTTRFNQLLKGNVDEIEDRQHFGAGIMSKKFADVKKRYWYRMVRSEAMPDIGFLFLVDGSGSMGGLRLKGAIESCIILHEVLSANNIQHSIVEHRAIYHEPLLEHNVMVSFSGRKEEKYNLLSLNADDGTREGLTLYWAEKYLQSECTAESKIIIMISDGAPAHSYEDKSGKQKDYYPPVSIKDTALAVKKITRRGTGIVAIALTTPGEDDCYGQLKVMYKDVVACTGISKLTGQLLGLITKCLRKSDQ